MGGCPRLGFFFEVGIAFSPNAPSVLSLIQADSDTFAQLAFGWDVDGWFLDCVPASI